MAAEVERLFHASNVREERIFVMAGHTAGLVVLGASVEDAMASLMRHRFALASGAR